MMGRLLMPEVDLFIGFDIGTTQVKGGVFTSGGTRVAGWHQAYPTSRPGPGVVEQDPRHWLEGVRTGLAALLEQVDACRIAALGLCSQINTDVFVDADGQPLAPAIMWQDVRAQAQAARLNATISGQDKARWWGTGVEIREEEI